MWPRRSGVLLHISSLPGRFGIGDLGPAAYRFVDWLVEAKQSLWNILPLNPTGYGDSPYQAFSAFAGNPYFISIDRLIKTGWLSEQDLINLPDFPDFIVEYGEIIPHHLKLLALAYERFSANASADQRSEFNHWCEQEEYWLDDYSIFMTLKTVHGGVSFDQWPKNEVKRAPGAIGKIKKDYRDQIEQVKYKQWLFYTQWDALKQYANSRGIEIVGDMPIYTSFDCSEVWARPELFHLDKNRHPTLVAGVPPDYFSATGQLWGNPIYDWEAHRTEGFHWWIERFKMASRHFDICRIDHFRGFSAYWEVPAGNATAEFGRWVPGPGQEFFDTVLSAIPDLRITAEDLGEITPDVVQLREDNGFPGIVVLQFAWYGDYEYPFLPHNHHINQIVYPGTHDNSTTVAWWERTREDERIFFQKYTRFDQESEQINWVFIQLAMRSVAHTCIIPMQDILGLGDEACMNRPGRSYENWGWRVREAWLDDKTIQNRLAQYTCIYGRDIERHPG